jgi:predicted amino acid dehydrogenase
VYGLKGRVFSVVETVEQVSEKHGLEKYSTTVAILGVGEIGEAIIRNLEEKGYRAVGIDIQIKDGRVELCNEGLKRLKQADLVVVQTPRGDDVVPYYADLKKTAILVDDAHPRITVKPGEVKFYKVAIGRSGVEFKPPLPGYEKYWIPGCVQESLVVAESGKTDMPQEEFNRRSKELGFFAHMVDDR